jgi:hypothetical protein
VRRQLEFVGLGGGSQGGWSSTCCACRAERNRGRCQGDRGLLPERTTCAGRPVLVPTRLASCAQGIADVHASAGAQSARRMPNRSWQFWGRLH